MGAKTAPTIEILCRFDLKKKQSCSHSALQSFSKFCRCRQAFRIRILSSDLCLTSSLPPRCPRPPPRSLFSPLTSLPWLPTSPEQAPHSPSLPPSPTQRHQEDRGAAARPPEAHCLQPAGPQGPGEHSGDPHLSPDRPRDPLS